MMKSKNQTTFERDGYWSQAEQHGDNRKPHDYGCHLRV